MMHAPGINLMYGDDEGNIAWWASAKLPIRPAHVDTKTAIDGSDPANDPKAGTRSREPTFGEPRNRLCVLSQQCPDSVAGVHYPGHYYAGNTRGLGIMLPSKAKTIGP